MLRALALFALLAIPTYANVQFLTSLPGGALSTAIRLDAAGNIFIAGSYGVDPVHGTTDAFIAKLSPDGSKILYFTPLGGGSVDAATALTLAPDGSAYVAGTTNSADFPVTPGAMQPTYSNGGQYQGFLVKVDPAGAVIYSTLINGTSTTQITGMALTPAGELFLTGIGGPGYSVASGQAMQGFLMKFDVPLAKILLSTYGYGGGLIQLDSSANIYLAGEAYANLSTTPGQTLALPTLPSGGFQSTHDARFCLTLGSGPGGGGSQFPCHYQYVAKLNPAGTVLWATYVTGTYGATVRGMALDSLNNIIVAGSTNSDDYPVTPGAFQTAYAASAPPLRVVPSSTYRDPPPPTGYITKVNAAGTGLIWSTYFGGSYADQITGMAVTAKGELWISGRAGSDDLPALAGTPEGCRPSANQKLGFLARVAPDGAAAGPTQLIAGAPDCLYFGCPVLSGYPSDQANWPLALRPDGTAIVAGTSGTVASVDSSSASRLTCIADPADNAQLRSVTPGQLISFFGNDLAPAGGASPASNFAVSFNGIAAPILYSSPQQINVQVPYEIASQSTVQLQVTDQQIPLALSETRTLGVAGRQPAIFLSPAAAASPFPGYTVCGGITSLGAAAVAINADGTLNDCTNPAIAGTTVTLFLNGLGPVTPTLATGAIAQSPAVPVTPAVAAFDSTLSPMSAATMSIPGTITGVAQVQLQLPLNAGTQLTPLLVTPTVLGKNTRERLALIWTRAK